MSQAYTPKPFSLLEPIGREDIIANTGKEPQFTPREPGFLETLGKSKIDQEGFAAGLQDTLIPLLDRAYLASGYHEQPGYSVDMTQWEKDRDYVDPDLRINLLNARSSGEYNALLADARITTESRRILAERGYGGVVSSVAAQILAPENLLTLGAGTAAGSVRGVRAAATAFSAGTAITQAGLSDNITAMDALGGFAGDATFFLSMSKLGAANRGVKALAGGVSQAVPNALATAVQEDRGLAEVGAAAGMSFMLGGIFGASTPAPRTQAAAMHDKAVRNFGEKLVKIGENTDPTGKTTPLSPDTMDWAHTYVGHFDEQTLNEWKNPSGKIEMFTPDIQSLRTRDGVLYHGTRSNDISSFIDSEGNLVLKPSSNFDGKQYGVSLTQQLDVANDYRTRVPGDAMRSDAQGYVFEISADAIPSSRRKVQSDTEIQVNDGDVVIPKGKYKIIKDPSASDGLVAWESARTKEAASYSDQELANAWKTQDNSASVSEHFHENQDGGKIASGVSQDIAAKYGKSNPELWFTNQELDKRIALSANPEAEAEKFAKLIGDSPFYSTEWLKTNLLETAMAYKGKQPAVDPSFSGTFRAGGENPASAAPLQNPYRRQDYKAGDIDGSRINIDAQGQTTLKLGKLDTKIPIALNPVNWITAGADNLARAYANIVGTNFVPRKDGTANYGVIAQRDDRVRSRRLVYTQALNSNYDTLQARQKAAGARVTPFHEFKSQVADAIESLDRPELLRQFDPEVVAMANKQADLQLEDLHFAIRHRQGELPEEMPRGYVTHAWQRNQLDRLISELGSSEAKAFISRAIEKELEVDIAEGGLFPDLERAEVVAQNKELADRIADRLLKVGGRRGGLSRLEGISAWELREELETTLGPIDDKDFNHLKSILIQKKEDPNPRFRSRLPIDSLHEEEINGKVYRIKDLLERDADALYARYAFRMASDAALNEARRVYALKTGENLPETHAGMQSWAVERYGDNTNNAQRVIHMDRVLRGFPTEYINDTTFNRAAAKVSKVLRDGTHISVMGDPRAGINQAIEGAAIFANPELSLSFVNRVMPGMSDVIGAFKRGEMPKHELMAHIMEARGTGLSSAVRNGGQRIDTNDASLRKLSAFEAKSQAVSHFMSKHVSMEQPLAEATQAFAEMGVIGRFITEAEGDAASKLAPERLAALNLDEKMNNRIMTEIRRHGQKNESGEIVHPRDMEWNDVDAAVAFREAVAIATKRVTNYRDQTTLGPWASTWWGKMLTQLQSYSLNAQGNIMQTQLGFADAGALKVIIAQSAMGMATLAVGALLAAPAQEDPEAYLERRLSAKNVALSSLGRAAWTGMMPRAYDVAAASMGFDPAFSQTRSAFISRDHGASSLAFNFAAQDTMISMLGSPGALLNALPGGDPFTDRDFDTMWKASMLPTTLQVHRAIRNALDLPERPN